MILIIDNYDPHMREFYKYITSEYANVSIIRNDEMPAENIAGLSPEAVIIGSGAGTVKDTGVCMDTVRLLCGKIPVLGIGLGAEVIGESFGCSFERIPAPEGRIFNTSFDTACTLFEGMNQIVRCCGDVKVSLDPQTLPESLYVTARDEYRRCIAFAHRDQKTYGLQIYPVFLGDDEGRKIIRNFIEIIKD